MSHVKIGISAKYFVPNIVAKIGIITKPNRKYATVANANVVCNDAFTIPPADTSLRPFLTRQV